MKYQGDMALQEPVRSLWTDHDVQQPDRCATDLGRPLATPGGQNTLRAIVADDRALWLATLTAHERDMADKRGSSPDFCWQAGRRYATEYGVTYRFRRVDREEPEYRLILAYDLAEWSARLAAVGPTVRDAGRSETLMYPQYSL